MRIEDLDFDRNVAGADHVGEHAALGLEVCHLDAITDGVVQRAASLHEGEGAATRVGEGSVPRAADDWRLAAGGDTEDPTYCRKETVPNSRFQKERCVKLSQLQRQQVLDRRNKEIGSLGGKQCGPGTSWCESH